MSEHQDESLRIIPDELFERAQARTRAAANSDKRLKSGGRAKYLLSGLLVCNVCKAHYVIADSPAAAIGMAGRARITFACGVMPSSE